MPIALVPGELREIILDCDKELDKPTRFYVKVPSKEQEMKFLNVDEKTSGLELMHMILEELLDSWKDWYKSDGTPVSTDTPVSDAVSYLAANDRVELATKASRRGLDPATVEKSE